MSVQLDRVCRHCTVRIESGDVCDFCASYIPPGEHLHDPNDPRLTCDQCTAYRPVITGTELLESAVTNATMAIEDATDALQAMPSDAPLWSSVDLTTAIGHLRLAVVKINKAAERINEAVVTR